MRFSWEVVYKQLQSQLQRQRHSRIEARTQSSQSLAKLTLLLRYTEQMAAFQSTIVEPWQFDCHTSIVERWRLNSTSVRWIRLTAKGRGLRIKYQIQMKLASNCDSYIKKRALPLYSLSFKKIFAHSSTFLFSTLRRISDFPLFSCFDLVYSLVSGLSSHIVFKFSIFMTL